MKHPHDGSLLWRMLWRFVYILIPLVCRLRVEGSEHVPKQGGCVLASNHTMGPDYILLALAPGRQIYYMAKAEAFQIHPWITKIILQAGVFPIKRGEGDSNALVDAVGLAKTGHMVGMFPEGTRSRTGQLQRGRSGVIRIAMEAQVPVVPVVVINSEQIYTGWRRLKRPEIIIRFGKPLIFDGDRQQLKVVQEHTHQLMLVMAELLPPALQGIYKTNVVQ